MICDHGSLKLECSFCWADFAKKARTEGIAQGRRQMAILIEKKFDEFGQKDDLDALADFANWLYEKARKARKSLV